MIKQKLTTKNKSSGTNTREYVVLHHTGTKDGTIRGVLNTLTTGAVSCHFVVDTNGDIYQIGELTDILWHGGISSWDGKSDMNKYSVGIEVIGPLPGFTTAQRVAVRTLLSYLLKELKLTPDKIIRHKDIAPKRKTDIDDSFFNNEYKTFSDYQNSFTIQQPIMEDNKYKAIYLKERNDYQAKVGEAYTPSFSDYTDDTNMKYLIEISNIRQKMKAYK